MRTNRSNIEEFILKATKVHGNKYDYSSAKYINSRTKIDIICLKHGVFSQLPTAHLFGQGCRKCGGENHRSKLEGYLNTRKNQNRDKIKVCQDYSAEFIKSANIIHCGKYNYGSIEYINRITPVKIYCSKHGYFWQAPNVHLMGSGCQECGSITQGNSKTKSAEKFIIDAQKIHGSKYDYSLVQYISSHIKVKIICKKHGIFTQQPSLHLWGHDCEKCGYDKAQKAQALSQEEFLKRAKYVHGNKYDYSLVQYISGKNKVKIICKKHGIFEQRPENHALSLAQGCPKCGHVISVPEIAWLNSLNIPPDKNHRNVSLKACGKWFRVDGFSPETQTIYEFNGDYFHGNPAIFGPNDINKKVKRTFGELHQRTIEKERILKQAGYNVISIWESDFNLLRQKSLTFR